MEMEAVLKYIVFFICTFIIGFTLGKQAEISDCERYGNLRDNGKIYECKQIK